MIKVDKLLALLLALLLTVGLTACAQPGGSSTPAPQAPLPFAFETVPPSVGSGTEADPWQLSTPEHLAWMADPSYRERLTGHFLLINDITAPDNLVIAPPLEGLDSREVRAASGFRGIFDGNGHTITVNIYLPEQVAVGLFGHIGVGSRVQNLTVAGQVKGREAVGGLAGLNDGEITNSIANVEVTGYFDAGGLVGISNRTIQNSSATGNVSGASSVGGLVGGTASMSEVINSHASGNVESSRGWVGGLVGSNGGRATIINSHATGDVSGYRLVGGLAGSNSGTIQSSSATGNVTGERAVGGLVGTLHYLVVDSHASGNVSGGVSVGGLIGYGNGGTVQNSRATGDVNGERDVGGLIGRSRTTVKNSYATGNVSGSGTHAYPANDG